MSSTNYMKAGKHLIQQKINEICLLKEQIQKEVQQLDNDILRDANTLLQTNDRKLFRSKYKDINVILETSLLRLHSISSSLRQDGSCSDSDSSFEETEFDSSCDKENSQIQVAKTSETNTNLSVSHSEREVVASSPIPFVNNLKHHFEDPNLSVALGSLRVEEKATSNVASREVSKIPNGSVRNRDGDDANDNFDDCAVRSSMPVKVNERASFTESYDADFKLLMAKLDELKKKVPISALSEDAAVRELLAQQVNDFFGGITDKKKRDRETIPVPINDMNEEKSSDVLQISKNDESTVQVETEVVKPNVKEEMATFDSCYRDIDGLEIKVGTELVGVVTHIESPSLFYVRPLDLDTQEILIDNLNEHYDSQCGEQVMEKPYLGMCCCAVDVKRNTWYRAIVTEIHNSKSSKNEVTVFYVDYGHSEKMPFFRLKKLNEAFRNIPRQAVSCCLFDVEPPEQRCEFTEDEIEKFRELVSNSNVKIKFCSLGPVRSVEVTQLQTVLEDDEPLNVSVILMKAGMASYKGRVQLPTSEIPAEKNNKELITLVSDVESNIPNTDCFRSSRASDVNVVKTSENTDKHPISFSISPGPSRLGKSSPFFIESDNDSTSDELAEAIETDVISRHNIQHESKHTRKNNKETQDVDLLGRFDIPLLKLNAKKSEFLQGMTETINSPSDFYIHFANEEVAKIDILHNEMDETLSNNEAPPLILDPARIAVGSYWSCRSLEDGRWYRAKIIEVKVEDSSSSSLSPAAVSSDDEVADKKKKRKKRQKPVSSRLPKVMVHVLYIDYGNFAWVGSDSLRMIYKKFCKLPALAVKCQMAHVKSKGKDGKWSSEATQCLRRWVSDKMVKVQFFDDINTILPDMALNVYLWDLDAAEGKIFNEELVKHGFATSDIFLDTYSSLSNNHCDDEIKNLERFDPTGDDYKSARNSYAVDVDDAGVALTGYKARDEQDICMFYQRKQPCLRGLGCPYKHIQPSKDGTTTDKKAISSIKEMVKFPPVGELVVVTVTAIENPGKFFVNFPITSEPVNKLKKMSDWTPPSENLYILNEELQKEYNKPTSQRYESFLIPGIGEMVAAKYSEDDCWYRAQVLEFYRNTNTATVYFVDYGNTENVAHHDMREIHTRFLHLPMQAVECTLSGIKPSNDEFQWCERSRSIFERLLPANCLSIEAIDINKVGQVLIKVKEIWGNKLCVTLHNMTSNSDVIINDALVNAQVASYASETVDEPKVSSKRSSLSIKPFPV